MQLDVELVTREQLGEHQRGAPRDEQLFEGPAELVSRGPRGNDHNRGTELPGARLGETVGDRSLERRKVGRVEEPCLSRGDHGSGRCP